MAVHDTLNRIRDKSNAQRDAEAAASQQQKISQDVIRTFQQLVQAMNGNRDTSQAILDIMNLLEKHNGNFSEHKQELDVLRAGLAELQNQVETAQDNPDLLPQFLRPRESVKVENLEDLREDFRSIADGLENVLQAIQEQQVTVEAPRVNVPAPIVNTPDVNLAPLEDAIGNVVEAVKKSQLKLDDKVISTKQTNTLIDFEFDQYKIAYDEFDDDEPKVSAVTYFLKGKQVGKLKPSYNKDGKLTGMKRV